MVSSSYRNNNQKLIFCHIICHSLLRTKFSGLHVHYGPVEENGWNLAKLCRLVGKRRSLKQVWNYDRSTKCPTDGGEVWEYARHIWGSILMIFFGRGHWLKYIWKRLIQLAADWCKNLPLDGAVGSFCRKCRYIFAILWQHFFGGSSFQKDLQISLIVMF